MNDTERLIRDDARRRYGDLPDPAATWARMAPRLQPRDARGGFRSWRPSLARRATALGVLLLIGMVLAGGLVAHGARPAPVGAAEILTRAGRAPEPGSPTMVRGYRGTITNQYREAYDLYQTTNYDPAAAPLRSSAATIWFRAPASWRIAAAGYLGVTDGAVCWSEDGGRRRAVRVDLARCDLAAEFGPADPGGLAGADGRDYAARRGADATIAGRPAYAIVVVLAPLPVPTIGIPRLLAYPPSATGTIIRTLWIDQETYLVLGAEDRDPRGTFLTGWAYTDFTPDPPLDQGLFTYAPPPGYAIIDQRRPATPTP